MIPPFILAKLYVKGSLQNNEDGFEFSLKNIIDSTMLTSIGPVVAGDRHYDAGSIRMQVGEESFDGESISKQKPVPVRMSIPMKFTIIGDRLDTGENRITVTAISSDIGEITIEINDSVAA